MRFIEVLFGVSPDGGSGGFELLLVLIVLLLVEPVWQLVYVLRKQ